MSVYYQESTGDFLILGEFELVDSNIRIFYKCRIFLECGMTRRML